MPDSITLWLPTLNDALKLARACGFKVGVQEPFHSSDRVWIDLARPGQRYGSHVTGPEVGRHVGSFRVKVKLTDDNGNRIELDPLATAAKLRLTATVEREREGVGR